MYHRIAVFEFTIIFNLSKLSICLERKFKEVHDDDDVDDDDNDDDDVDGDDDDDKRIGDARDSDFGSGGDDDCLRLRLTIWICRLD